MKVRSSFKVVSITKSPTKKKHVVEPKLIKVGVIEYSDGSGGEAVFVYEAVVRFNKETHTLPIVRESLSIIGKKFCYCYNRFDPISPNKIIKYVPETKFLEHPYNSYKYKPGSLIRAEVKNDKAYAIN